ncbi:MAG: FMN-binding protein [Gordonia sp. (in: high G+C Gram-positive bacteria)]
MSINPISGSKNITEVSPERGGASSRRIAAGSGGLAVAVAAIGFGAGCASGAGPSDAGSAHSATPVATAVSGIYRDGKYSATGHYRSPGGPQQLGVTVTLSNSVITALSVDTSKTRGTSKQFQGKFAGGIDALVVGKNIDHLNVHKVAGSSLTSNGFNDAIEQIKNKARG